MGFALFWLLSPFFTGSAFTATSSSSSSRCIREAELPFSFPVLGDNETLIMNSIYSEPEFYHEKKTSFFYPDTDPK